MKEYLVAALDGPLSGSLRPAPPVPDLTPGWDWDAHPWGGAEALDIASFRPEGSSHRPLAQAKVLYDRRGVRVLFRVEDRYVRSVHTEHNSRVCEDSCVELFVRPRPDRGYFNFEANCGGTLHCSYIEDWTRTPEGFRRFTLIPEADCAEVVVHHTAPRRVDPEHEEPMVWRVGLFVPFSLFEKYAGPLGPVEGATWRVNFYKCGDATSHPHWAAWNPVSELNFHAPDDFGMLRFGERGGVKAS